VLTMGNPKVSGLAESLPPALSGPDDAPPVLDSLRLWVGIALTLVVLAYALPLAAIVQRGGLFGPGVGTYPAWLVPLYDTIAGAATPIISAVNNGIIALVEVV
ncbi:cytochrome C oxidase subunit I, partial [Halorubrum sp. SD626R]